MLFKLIYAAQRNLIRERFIKNRKKKKLKKISFAVTPTYVHKKSFFPHMSWGKNSGKKEKEKQKFQHFWRTPTYLKLN